MTPEDLHSLADLGVRVRELRRQVQELGEALRLRGILSCFGAVRSADTALRTIVHVIEATIEKGRRKK